MLVFLYEKVHLADWLITLLTGVSETVVAPASTNGLVAVPGCARVAAEAGVTTCAAVATAISLQEMVLPAPLDIAPVVVAERLTAAVKLLPITRAVTAPL